MIDPKPPRTNTWMPQDDDPDLRATLRADAPAAGPVRVPDEGLSIGQVLGEGGMGVVALGDQGRLRREVAVKRLKPGAPSGVAHALLQEAWVTGALEHPNIVPVHDLLIDEDGQPQIVLKRIEGTEWEALLAGQVPLPDEGRDDPHGWHLRILMSVCNAVEFAHRQGVVHRDLKPENVMVGAFGEVYVLDWGIAMGLRPDPRGRFPLAADQRAMVGTPVYMAPEMFQADLGRLGPGTDVYLLAGMLYRVLAGRPPHQGSTLTEIRASAQRVPALDPGWPQDLRELLRSAMDADPSARPDAGAFRRALQTHLDRRALQEIHRAAVECAARLDGLLDPAVDDPAHQVAVHDAVGAARFGLKEVLAGWPDHPDARAVLEDLHGRMVRYELARGQSAAARMWLQRLETAAPDLAAQVEALAAREQRDRERLQQLRAELDRGTGLLARVLLLVLLAVAWVGFPVVAGLLGWELDYLRVAVQYTGVLGLLLIAGVVLWRPIRASRVNRGFWMLAFLSSLFTLLALFLGWQLDQGIHEAMLVKTLCDAALACVAASLFEVVLVPAAVIYVGLAALGAMAPAWGYTAGRVGTVILVLNVLLAWPKIRLRR